MGNFFRESTDQGRLYQKYSGRLGQVVAGSTRSIGHTCNFYGHRVVPVAAEILIPA